LSQGTLVLTPGFRGDDGLSLLAREVAGALRGIGSDADVWSLLDKPDGPNRGEGIRGAGGSRLRFGAWGIAEGAVRQPGRRVITLHTHLLPVALPAVYRGARLIHLVVGIDAWKPLSTLQAATLRRAWRLAAISQHSSIEFRRANPWFGTAHIPVCHPGLPDLESDPAPSIDKGYALIVGRMSSEERYKGHDVLLELWGDLRTKVPGTDLLVAGEGDDRLRLEEKAKTLGVAKEVRFLGKVPRADLHRLYRECGFLVMPSRHEGFGFVFLEAMRAGKACVGARGAASEIIEDGATGYVVDPDDPRAILSAIEKLAVDRGRRTEMGAKGRRRFQACFTRGRFEERLSALVAGN
jgi:glycosyltransferase involved in cell wall biosynthesis